MDINFERWIDRKIDRWLPERFSWLIGYAEPASEIHRGALNFM